MVKLNEFERAAILLHVVGKCNDRHILFQVAEGTERYNRLTTSTKAQTVSRWFNSDRIKEGIKQINYDLRREEEEKRDQIIQEYQDKEVEKADKEGRTAPEAVNFLDPDEFLKFASLKANEIQNEKERRPYLEMIAKLMNYKDKDEQEQEQIRAYIPIVCEKCDLYNRCKTCKAEKCPI